MAHVLGACAGYASADTNTVATMMTRLGLPRHACVRVSETVSSMLVFSTAYVVQSACGRVVVVSYRGTEPDSIGNWLGDAEVGTDFSTLSIFDVSEKLRVHAGFHRSVRATFLPIVDELTFALQGRSLLDHRVPVEHPLQALYLTGHSLGGALAMLFAMRLSANPAHRALSERLRAVYTLRATFDRRRPSAQGPRGCRVEGVPPRQRGDPIPALPPALWGDLRHVGHEYRLADDRWRRADSPTAQLETLREFPRSLLAFFAGEGNRASYRYSMGAHGAHHYLAALRPPNRITEYGDLEP